MKKTQLKKIIKESIKELMTEQYQPNSYVTAPFFDMSTGQPSNFIQNMITALLPSPAGQGRGCQFVCNRLDHLANKYNTKVQSGAGAAQGGFGNTNQGQILSSKINYLANLGQNYNFLMCQVNGGTTQSCGMTSGGCGCPPPTMM